MTTGDNMIGIDLGTSSARALLFDKSFTQYENLGSQKRYQFDSKVDGSVEVDPDFLVTLVGECLDQLHAQMASSRLVALGVGMCTFWHCFVGVDKDHRPTTPVVHLLDTRSKNEVAQLAEVLEASWIHAITGCMPHTSYWPAKLLWFRNNRPDAFKTTVRWMSVSEYVLLKFTGQQRDSLSMISASGMWDQRRDDYCDEILEVTGVHKDQLSPVESLDKPVLALSPEFAARWPLFHGIPWCPAYGDGASNSVGSGCVTPQRFALMVGTTGAMRAIVKRKNTMLPAGIWGYRVNHQRSILGGATSNGGEVFRWVNKIFQLPNQAEEEIAGREPGSHGLTVLPYLAGERSPYWSPDLRATVTGMGLSTTPVDVLQAWLESVSLRFRQIYTLLKRPFSAPEQVIASGGGLLQSKVWPQMMADALGHSLQMCIEPEASSRGAAMLAAESLGFIRELEDIPPRLGAVVEPDKKRTEAYRRMLERDRRLYAALYGSKSAGPLHLHPHL